MSFTFPLLAGMRDSKHCHSEMDRSGAASGDIAIGGGSGTAGRERGKYTKGVDTVLMLPSGRRLIPSPYHTPVAEAEQACSFTLLHDRTDRVLDRRIEPGHAGQVCLVRRR